MGLLIDGQWHDQWYDTKTTGGAFKRQDSLFRHWVRADGSTDFLPESGRYHLYVSLACPWAHRTLIMRKLKGLEAHIDISVVNPLMVEKGWTFDPDPGVIPDPLQNAACLYEIYTSVKPDITSRVTVPILWDKQKGTIVNNESSEIIRMFNAEFTPLADPDAPDFYPEPLRGEIDAINQKVYDSVNNGVYKAGFATSQSVYEEAVSGIFATLDELEARLSRQPFLASEQITEADWRLFTTLIRFDAVYVGHFKCNWRRIADYPNLWAYTRQLYQWPGVAETVDFEHIKGHYYRSHTMINPTQVVPSGPILDLDSPHGRG